MFAGGGGLAEFSSFMPFLVCRLNEWKFAWVFEQMGVEDCIKLATDCCCRLFCLFLWQVERGVSPLSHAYLYRLEKARVWGLTYSLSVEKKLFSKQNILSKYPFIPLCKSISSLCNLPRDEYAKCSCLGPNKNQSVTFTLAKL